MGNTKECLLPDEAIENATKFGFDDYSTLLASVIKDSNLQTPFTISIYGEWGSGKTSLMKTVYKKLESTKGEIGGVKTIWFSAWEFQKLQAPLWTVFINRIIIDLHEMMPNKILKNQVKALGKGFMLLSADALLSRTLGIKSKDIEEVKERVWNDIKRIDCLREDLSNNINTALKRDPQRRTRLVIFVDDLDRCLPEQSVDIFESMKLFLNCKNCVFVIGVDKEQIRKIFEQKFNTKDEKRGLSYVEKFIQLEFELPPKTAEEVYEFVMENASEQLARSPETIELISKFIEPNPRKIKRWLNSVMLLEKLFKIKQEKTQLENISEVSLFLATVWLFLKSFFPDFAGLITPDPSVLNTAINVAKGKEDKQKIGDFTLDKRLSEFLSFLQPSIVENQLSEIIHLSKLTPVADFSSVPRDQKGTVRSLKNLAVLATSRNEFEKAVKYYTEALKIYKEMDNKQYEALFEIDIGNAYSFLNDRPNAIDHYTKGLEIAKQIGDTILERVSEDHLGSVYYLMGEHFAAIDHYTRSLEIAKQTSDKQSERITEEALARVCSQMFNPLASIEHFTKALEITKEIGDKKPQEVELEESLGSVYYQMNDYPNAVDHYTKGLEIAKQIGDNPMEAYLLDNLGTVFGNDKNYFEALKNYMMAEQIRAGFANKESFEQTKTKIEDLRNLIGREEFDRLVRLVKAELVKKEDR